MAAAIPLEKAHRRSHPEQRGLIWGGIILSTCLHFAVFALWPSMEAEDIGTTDRAITTIEIPPEVIVPPAPEALTRPPVPVITNTLADENITIPDTDWDSYPVEALQPPADTGGQQADKGHVFAPYTVAPALENGDEISRALQREYPTLLRDAGIGGTVRVGFFIDEAGRVLETRIEQGSGHGEFDRAALRVAEMMEFSPAMNRDKPVPVWVQFPITFQVRE